MSATFDFERMLGTVLEASGPTVAPEDVVDTALVRARSVGQRHRAPVLDRRVWPPRAISLGNPAVRRMATIAIVALLLAAMAAAAVSIGSKLLRSTRPVWLPTGTLSLGRDDSAMVVLLADGRVLAMGGRPNPTGRASRSAEVYDPATNRWTPIADMLMARNYGSATLLRDGRVLVAGGSDPGVTAELFDPKTGRWTATGNMVQAHTQHAAILLPSGKVLVAGGTSGPDGEQPRTTAELYDPASGTWRSTGAMVIWRASPTITLLPDGTVLVVEGFGPGIELWSAEIYDPAREAWTLVDSLLTDARADDQSATLLPNGKVLVVGGARSLPELYDPAARSFTPITPMPQPQRWHTATLLPDGRVLFAGGGYGELASGPLTNVVLYDSIAASWTSAAPLVEARMGSKAVLLRDGSVLVVGGVDASNSALASVERFGPRPWSLFGD